ncbi:hypothetical protein LB505_005041 [Fusarium chuoi]|nr:hypothetical protein LB505_005041 [Fusarium chuoi]
MGGAADPRYNLSFIVEQSVALGKPVIGVGLNYRLSAFGFLVGKEAMKEGATNLGFRDQRLALSWINENIASFGGDPNKDETMAFSGELWGSLASVHLLADILVASMRQKPHRIHMTTLSARSHRVRNWPDQNRL